MRRRIAAAAGLSLVLVALSGCFLDPAIEREQTRREAFDYYTQGLDLESKGDYTPALDLFLKAIETDARPAFYYHAGLCHARLAHDDMALEYFDKALALAPDYELARAERELILQRQAMASRREAEGLQTPPAAATGRTGEIPGAKVESSLSPASAPGSTSASAPTPSSFIPSSVAEGGMTPVGAASSRGAGLPPAEDVRKALFPELANARPEPAEGAPGWGAGSNNLPEFHFPPSEDDQARLASEAGRLEQAAFYLEDEVRQKPEDFGLRLRLARVYARSGRLSRAEAELRESARLAPENAEVWYEWGGFYIRQENWSEAERCYMECLRIDPVHAKARNNLGVVLLKIGLWEQAAGEFLKVIGAQSDFASAYLNLAVIEAHHHDNLDQAVAYAEDYIRFQGSRTAEVRRWRQNLLLRKGALPAPEAP